MRNFHVFFKRACAQQQKDVLDIYLLATAFSLFFLNFILCVCTFVDRSRSPLQRGKMLKKTKKKNRRGIISPPTAAAAAACGLDGHARRGLAGIYEFSTLAVSAGMWKQNNKKKSGNNFSFCFLTRCPNAKWTRDDAKCDDLWLRSVSLRDSSLWLAGAV